MRLRKLFISFASLWFCFSLTVMSSEKEPVKKLTWPAEVKEIQYFCSADRSQQPAMFYTPKTDAPIPLLVGLHSWSADYRQRDPGVYYARWCIEKNWVFIHPNFRGPNNKPQATGSEFVVQDIKDAVTFSTQKANVDVNRIYLVGSSGGGYAALLMAGRAPEIWAGVSAWVPIVDLVAWHQESRERKNRYAAMIESSVGGPPLLGASAYAESIKRSPITYLKNAQGLPLDINAGINDGHNGSVPISHSLRAFNRLAKPKDKISEADIQFFIKNAAAPELLKQSVSDATYGNKQPLFRRTSGKTRITIFDGGHEIIPQAALNWLAKQRRIKEYINHK